MSVPFDGLSFETALSVDSVEEEYEWLEIKYPKYRLIEQSVQYHKGIPFDIIIIELKDTSHVSVYFDISEFFEKDSELLTDGW